MEVLDIHGSGQSVLVRLNSVVASTVEAKNLTDSVGDFLSPVAMDS